MNAAGSSGGPETSRAVAQVSTDEVELFLAVGHDGQLREVNEAFARLLGMAPAELIDRSILELVHPDELATVLVGMTSLQAGAPEVMVESRFRQQDGGWVHLQWVARPTSDLDQWWAAGRDTTAFHRLLAEGVDLRARLDLALGQSNAAMWQLDIAEGRFDWEAHAAHLLGAGDKPLPVTVAELAAAVHPADAATVVSAVTGLFTEGVVEVELRILDGAEVRHLSFRGKVLDLDRRGRPLRAVGLLVEVSTEKAMEETLLRMILTDPLTAIPNRRAFDQLLRGEWRRCARTAEPLSVLMIDIDDFKRCNETLGHLVGDEILCVVARALTSCLHREGDAVARFGGEEFAVVLPSIDHQGALTVAERMLAAVHGLTIHQAPDWRLSVSIGIASALPAHKQGKSADLLTRADEALSLAKAEGKNRAVCYEDSLAAGAELRQAVAGGLTNGEFELYYQPVVELATDRVTGFEALIRWNRPGHGLVPPDDFIPAAESSDLICDLGRWVLTEATRQLSAWITAGVPGADGVRLAVNGSGRHIASPQIVADVAAALSGSNLPAHCLELELTETALVDDELVEQHLARIRDLGVTVSIDDFGTGYTSIGQLSHLHVDVLKIDRSFVASTDPRQQSLVNLMISAGHALDLRVIAEGIEDLPTLQSLRELGCDQAQGYYISRPLPAGEVPSWWAEWNRRKLTRAA